MDIDMNSLDDLRPEKSKKRKVVTLNKRIEQKNFIEALVRNHGNIDKTCKETGISRRKYQTWSLDIDFREMVEDCHDGLNDNVETALYKSAIEGNVQAQMFWLRKRRRVVYGDETASQIINFVPPPSIVIAQPNEIEEVKPELISGSNMVEISERSISDGNNEVTENVNQVE